MKTIKDAVIELDGKLPNPTYRKTSNAAGWYISATGKLTHAVDCVWFEPDKFEAESKRLGYINGYRWGVEYPTNGERPDLEDGVEVVCFGYDGVNCGNGRVFERRWDLMEKFKITDQRFKPADTSYLDAASVVRGDPSIRDELNLSKSLTHSEEGLTHSEWWDYDKLQVKSGKLIPVGSEVLFFDRAPSPFKCKVMYSSEYVTVIRCIDGSVNKEMIGVDISRCPFEENFNQIKPLDWNRKAEMEREKVIEAAFECLKKDGFDYDATNADYLEALYNAGMLVLTQDSSDTKD